jgi:hypothetical protein
MDLVEAMRSAGVELTRRWKRLVGHCPFHNDRHPSLVLSEDERAWYCHVCAFGGNAVEFVKRFHNVGVKEAFAILGQARLSLPSHSKAACEQRARLWAKNASNRLPHILREIGREMHAAGIQEGDFESALAREWAVLSDLAEDLNTELVHELWSSHKETDALIDQAESRYPKSKEHLSPLYSERKSICLECGHVQNEKHEICHGCWCRLW